MHQEFVVLVSIVPPEKYRFVLTVNQTAKTLSTRKIQIVYATILAKIYEINFTVNVK